MAEEGGRPRNVAEEGGRRRKVAEEGGRRRKVAEKVAEEVVGRGKWPRKVASPGRKGSGKDCLEGRYCRCLY